MATDDDDNKRLIAMIAAGTVMGIGLGIGLSAIEESNRRKRFHESLSNALRMLGMEPMSAEFGRGPDGMAEWHVTINHPARGIASYVVGFTADTPPYSDATLSELVNRLYRAVS